MKSTHSFSPAVRCFIAISFLFVCTQFMACSKGGNPSPKSKAEQVTAKLTASPWKVIGVSVDGADQTILFQNFTIAFTSSSFTTTHDGVVWPASGTWAFTDTDATAFTRGDGLIVQLKEVTDTSLKMSLTWNKNTFGPGRMESIKGQYVFVMGK